MSLGRGDNFPQKFESGAPPDLIAEDSSLPLGPITLESSSSRSTSLFGGGNTSVEDGALFLQIQVLWEREHPIIKSYNLDPEEKLHILEVGCGNGIIACKLLEMFPSARYFGVDVDEKMLDLTRQRTHEFSDRVKTQQLNLLKHDASKGDLNVHQLHDSSVPQPSSWTPFLEKFDLIICRHVTQWLRDPKIALGNMLSFLAPGGFLHILAEDLDLLYFTPASDHLKYYFQSFINGEIRLGCPLQRGRDCMPMLSEQASERCIDLSQLKCSFVLVDTVDETKEKIKARKQLLCKMFVGWCQCAKGFLPKTGLMPEAAVEAAQHETKEKIKARKQLLCKMFVGWCQCAKGFLPKTGLMPEAAVEAAQHEIIQVLESEHSYFSWLVPVITARRSQ
eukprot:TRINITY_DN5418_c0_g1_i1.p1 TRINITY_DN5418_c0_g1~~TRINITY_DN5418_c0_g1_i1.p1  ORF type:complete len:392 (+),score=91.48 TRINITY_DN5418_c0_g1_i1:60-1235(+)